MDFEKARFNMVEQQIRPWGVSDSRVLELMFHVKREEFVSDHQRALAFADIELPLPNGSYMLQPKLEGRLVQDLAVQPLDKVLEVGAGSGYVTALLASLAGQVFSIEIDADMKLIAEKRLKKANFGNVVLWEGNGLDGLPSKAPFDVILVGGSLPIVPTELKNQLAIGGRMLAVIGDEPVMSAKLLKRDTQSSWSETILFDTHITRLIGCEAIEPNRFIF